MSSNKVVTSDWNKLPWATIGAVLITFALGLAHIFNTEKLSFDDYSTQVVIVWGILAVGRGLALKEQQTVELAPFARFLNTFPWATVVVGIVAVVGYFSVVLGLTESLTYQELGTKIALLVGALGIGRGVGTLKKDVTYDKYGTAEEIAALPDASLEHEITEADVQAEFGSSEPLPEEPSSSALGMQRPQDPKQDPGV